MRYGLRTGLNNVVKLCLSAGADPNLRFESRWDLDEYFPPIPRPTSHQPNFHLKNGRLAHRPIPPEDSGEAIDGGFNTGITINTIVPFRSDKAFYWTPLHVAATRDDIELLSLLLDHGANPNSGGRGVCICRRQVLRRTFGRSLFSHQHGNVASLERRLLTRWSPLHVAVCKKSLDCAEELVRRFGLADGTESREAALAEAEQFFRDEPTLDSRELHLFNTAIPRFDPLSPLHVAVDRYASVDAIERVFAMLEKAGCLAGPDSSVDQLDDFGDTPFAVAALSGRIRTLGNWFRDHQANINFAIRDLNGTPRSVFNALCKSGLFEDALFLMDLGVDINTDMKLHPPAYWHESALHCCCRYGLYGSGGSTAEDVSKQPGALVLIKRLIRAGADVNAKAEGGTTCLMLAANLGFTDAVRELLEAKADVGAKDDNGHSALCHAVAHGLSLRLGPELDTVLLIIQLLLDNGADPNQRSEDSGPPLFTGRYDLVRSPVGYLETDNGGSIHSDIPRSSMVLISRLLISNGADPNVYLEEPRNLGNGSLVEQLENLGGRSLAVSAFYLGEYDSLCTLVESGTVVTLQDYLLMMRSLLDPEIPRFGRGAAAVEALFRVLNCPSKILQRLEDRKRIMDAWTEVLYLAVGSRPRLVHALASHICLTDMCGPGGKTVLHLMAQWKRKKNERPNQFEERIDEMMTKLFRCGVGRQIDQPDHSGRSPLHLAVDRGNVAVARQLVRFGASLHIEHRKPDGSTTISPLRSAIRKYSKASRFKVATNILEASSDTYGLTDRLPGNLGLLKDLILHFGGHPFDEPARMTARTTGLMEKLFAIGVSVNEPDEHGNIALHHLIQLLYPSNERSDNLGDQEGAHFSRSSSFAVNIFISTRSPASSDPERFFELTEEQDVDLNGRNLTYESDGDYDLGPDGYEEPMYGIFDDDSDISDDIDSEESFPRNELGELVSHDPSMASDRCHAWMSSFFFLLVNGASLRMRNNAGKTALDYIDELMGCQPPASPKMYGTVIPALRDFVKRPPFNPKLLAKLKGSFVKVKGTPLLLVHNGIHVSMDEDGAGEAHWLERQASARGETCWTPFW